MVPRTVDAVVPVLAPYKNIENNPMHSNRLVVKYG